MVWEQKLDDFFEGVRAEDEVVANEKFILTIRSAYICEFHFIEIWKLSSDLFHPGINIVVRFADSLLN